MTANEASDSVDAPVDGLDRTVPGIGDEEVPEPEPDAPPDPTSNEIGVLDT